MGAENVYYIRALTLVYAREGSTKTYYRFNGHGDVIALANASGAVIKRYKYDAFGVEENPDVFDTNVFRYCAEYYDIETKTVYLRARYYDAETGRFTQQDGWNYAVPGFPLSLNLYTYCNNDPIGYVDPSGHFISFRTALGIASGLYKFGRSLVKAHIRGGIGWTNIVKESVSGIVDGFCEGFTYKMPKWKKILFDAAGHVVKGLFGSLVDKIEQKEDLRSSKTWKEIFNEGLCSAGKEICKELVGCVVNWGIDKVLANIQDVSDWLVKVFEGIEKTDLVDKKYIRNIIDFIQGELPEEFVDKIYKVVSN